MIRADYLFLDVQDLFIAFWKAKQTGEPWDNWRFIKDYPNKLEFKQFINKKPIIFLERFQEIDAIHDQGHFLDLRVDGPNTYQDWGYTKILQARLGIWVHHKHGGGDELEIIKSKIAHSLQPPKDGVPLNTFDITYARAAAAITGTTLFAEGIGLVNLDGGSDIATEDDNEIRQELTLTVQALYGESVDVT